MSRPKLFVGILTTLLAFSLMVFLSGTLPVLSKPYELILGEGFLWLQSGIVERGEPLYREVTSSQLLVIPHTPLYVMVVGLLSRIFGNTLMLGRIVSLAFGGGVCYLVCLLTRKITGSWVVGILSGLLVVTTYAFRFLGPIYRMDTMGIFFSLVGIYLVLRFEGRGKLLYWSIPFFVLAFFTKQYFISAPIAVAIYLLVKNHWKVSGAARYTGVYLGVLGGSLLVGGLLTNWELIIHNLGYIAVGSKLDWTHFLGGLRQLGFYHIPILVGVVSYLGYKLYRRSTLSLVEIYFLVGSVVMVGSIGKVGASFHYGFEILVVGCILMGGLLGRALKVFKDSSLGLRPILLHGSVFVLVVLQVLGLPLGQGFQTFKYLESSEESSRELVQYSERVNGPIFTDVQVIPLSSADTLEWEPWEAAILFAGGLGDREGRLGWDESLLLERFESGYYKSVLFSYDLEKTWSGDKSNQPWWFYRSRLSLEMSSTILNNYKFVEAVGHLGTNFCPYEVFVYEYKGNTNRD